MKNIVWINGIQYVQVKDFYIHILDYEDLQLIKNTKGKYVWNDDLEIIEDD